MFAQGSKVYYKRDGQDRWRGPATVIGNDGSVYYVRHQGSLYRVSACRITHLEDAAHETNDGNNTSDNNAQQLEDEHETHARNDSSITKLPKSSSSIIISNEEAVSFPMIPHLRRSETHLKQQ